MHGMGGVISPCSLNTDCIIGRNTLHTNLNPFAPSFVYCVIITTPNSQEVYHERTSNIEQNSATTNSASYTMKLSYATLNESPDITNIYSPKILSDSFIMIAIHKLNPLAKIFTWGCDDDADLHDKGSMVTTNAIGRALYHFYTDAIGRALNYHFYTNAIGRALYHVYTDATGRALNYHFYTDAIGRARNYHFYTNAIGRALNYHFYTNAIGRALNYQFYDLYPDSN